MFPYEIQIGCVCGKISVKKFTSRTVVVGKVFMETGVSLTPCVFLDFAVFGFSIYNRGGIDEKIAFISFNGPCFACTVLVR